MDEKRRSRRSFLKWVGASAVTVPVSKFFIFNLFGKKKLLEPFDYFRTFYAPDSEIPLKKYLFDLRSFAEDEKIASRDELNTINENILECLQKIKRHYDRRKHEAEIRIKRTITEKELQKKNEKTNIEYEKKIGIGYRAFTFQTSELYNNYMNIIKECDLKDKKNLMTTSLTVMKSPLDIKKEVTFQNVFMVFPSVLKK